MAESGEKITPKSKDEGRFEEFPETVDFVGVGNPSMKSVHLISAFVLGVGALITFLDFPSGLLLLAIFIVIVLGFEMLILRRSTRPVKITLHLRKDPVEASQGMFSLGPITMGAINTDMESPNELGFRPAPGKEIRVWTFRTKEEAQIVAKRLLQYLKRDDDSGDKEEEYDETRES
jgi:hypothetical protein